MKLFSPVNEDEAAVFADFCFSMTEWVDGITSVNKNGIKTPLGNLGPLTHWHQKDVFTTPEFEAKPGHAASVSEGTKQSTNQIIEGQICLIIKRCIGNLYILKEASVTFCGEDEQFAYFIQNTLQLCYSLNYCNLDQKFISRTVLFTSVQNLKTN